MITTTIIWWIWWKSWQRASVQWLLALRFGVFCVFVWLCFSDLWSRICVQSARVIGHLSLMQPCCHKWLSQGCVVESQWVCCKKKRQRNGTAASLAWFAIEGSAFASLHPVASGSLTLTLQDDLRFVMRSVNPKKAGGPAGVKANYFRLVLISLTGSSAGFLTFPCIPVPKKQAPADLTATGQLLTLVSSWSVLKIWSCITLKPTSSSHLILIGFLTEPNSPKMLSP